MQSTGALHYDGGMTCAKQSGAVHLIHQDLVLASSSLNKSSRVLTSSRADQLHLMIGSGLGTAPIRLESYMSLATGGTDDANNAMLGIQIVALGEPKNSASMLLTIHSHTINVQSVQTLVKVGTDYPSSEYQEPSSIDREADGVAMHCKETGTGKVTKRERQVVQNQKNTAWWASTQSNLVLDASPIEVDSILDLV